MNYNTCNIFLLLLCAVNVNLVAAGLKNKCGIFADKCMILANGKIFWPEDHSKKCSSVPICPSGYRLHKEDLDDLHVCCCVYKRLHECPDCDMSYKKRLNIFRWIELNLSRPGPPEGKCLNGKLKRIFYGGFKRMDKCCCEPIDSPFL